MNAARGAAGASTRLWVGALAALWVVGAPAPASAEPLPDARVALVLEFLEVTEGGGAVAPLRAAFVERIDASYPQTFKEMLDELDPQPRERAALEARYGESLERFRAAFGRLFDEQIDLAVLARVLYAPIYTRHFSDAELRELVAFYRTPTGRKSLEVLPRAMGEVAREAAPALAPLIASLVHEAVAAEKKALRAGVD